MIYQVATAVFLGLTATAAFPTEMVGTRSAGEEVKVLNSAKTDRKWMVFPDQVTTQTTSANATLTSVDTDFFSKHATELGLTADHNMVLQKSTLMRGSKQTVHKYSQEINGVKVFGGDFIVVTGAHGNVLSTNGQALDARRASFDLMSSSHRDGGDCPEGCPPGHAGCQGCRVSSKEALSIVEEYVSEKGEKLSVKELKPTEREWFMSGAGSGVQGDVSLVQHVRGATKKSVFDAFVSVTDGSVVAFYEKTNGIISQEKAKALKTRKATSSSDVSPFASPLPGDIIVIDEADNNKLVFDTTTTPPPTYPVAGDDEMNDLIDSTLEVKDFYRSLSGGDYVTWRGYESELKITYHLDLANAYFDGEEGIHFGTGFIVDDVVSHEWSHAYTGEINGLIYFKESGALNEAVSDMMGEAIDILNNDGVYDADDTSVLRTVNPRVCHSTQELGNADMLPGTDAGKRWVMGEDVSYDMGQTGDDGSLRDMYVPECFSDPSQAGGEFYYCGRQDNGGVHTNSGVANRLFSVIVDGGEYVDPSDSSKTVAFDGMGMEKAVNLLWRASHLLTATSQFMDFGLAFQTTCRSNIGADLYIPELYTDGSNPTVSKNSFTETDCDNVDTALYGSNMISGKSFC